MYVCQIKPMTLLGAGKNKDLWSLKEAWVSRSSTKPLVKLVDGGINLHVNHFWISDGVQSSMAASSISGFGFRPADVTHSLRLSHISQVKDLNRFLVCQLILLNRSMLVTSRGWRNWYGIWIVLPQPLAGATLDLNEKLLHSGQCQHFFPWALFIGSRINELEVFWLLLHLFRPWKQG